MACSGGLQQRQQKGNGDAKTMVIRKVMGGDGGANCQTQHLWTQLHAKPKYMWVWLVVEPNIFGLSYMLSLSTYESSKLLDPTSLDLATC